MPGNAHVRIRPFDADRDAEALRGCLVAHQDFHRALEPSWPRGEAIAGEYQRFLETACAAHNGRILIAEYDGEMAGFVCVLASTRGTSPDDPAPFAWIQDIFVTPAHRRRGVATGLLAEAERFARSEQARVLRLGVLDRNRDARAFYLRHGFREHTHVLTKPLTDE
jgi:GNAT superfamily N-acetyltransferase